MLDTNQTLFLSSVRKEFYSKDVRYGEVFDSNFMDIISSPDITFSDCVKLSKEDTEQYIFLNERAADASNARLH